MEGGGQLDAEVLGLINTSEVPETLRFARDVVGGG